jgi:hypothetical protein
MIRTAAVLAALLAPAALAASDSAYTRLAGDGAHCTTLEDKPDEGGSFLQRCAGFQGNAVFVAEGDLRTFVSYGWNARAEKAASQTFPAFNTIGDTLEWRLKDGKPVATILRWKIDGGEGMPKGEVLVVTQLNEGNQCWIAEVSASMNANANELARQAADELAGTFDCENEMPRVYGTADYEVMGIE